MGDEPHNLRITQIATVFVPVSDQERALTFYLDRLGFEKRADFAYGGGHRWIEVAPPGSTIALALVGASEGASPGGDITRCAWATADIVGDHDALAGRGVTVDAQIASTGGGTSRTGLISEKVEVTDPVPPQFHLRDPDGNRFLLVEAG